MLLTPYGLREWLTATLLCGGLILAAIFLWWPASLAPAVLWLGVAMFFRDPPRRTDQTLDPSVYISPADGTISAVEQVESHESTEGPAVIIRIFLSLLNVHVNRAPCDGTVVKLTYKPGQFLSALTEESARVNESNLLTLRRPDGETVGVRQVSGKVARRIVCPLKPGDPLERGQRYGMIKFGSTTELILPRPGDVTLHVKKGDKVRAGRTHLATLASRVR